jgi:hypothetical protein
LTQSTNYRRKQSNLLGPRPFAEWQFFSFDQFEPDIETNANIGKSPTNLINKLLRYRLKSLSIALANNGFLEMLKEKNDKRDISGQ